MVPFVVAREPPQQLNTYGTRCLGSSFKGIPQYLNTRWVHSFKGTPAAVEYRTRGLRSSFKGIPQYLNTRWVHSFKRTPAAVEYRTKGLRSSFQGTTAALEHQMGKFVQANPVEYICHKMVTFTVQETTAALEHTWHDIVAFIVQGAPRNNSIHMAPDCYVRRSRQPPLNYIWRHMVKFHC